MFKCKSSRCKEAVIPHCTISIRLGKTRNARPFQDTQKACASYYFLLLPQTVGDLCSIPLYTTDRVSSQSLSTLISINQSIVKRPKYRAI